MWNLKQLSEEELKDYQERHPLAPKPEVTLGVVGREYPDRLLRV